MGSEVEGAMGQLVIEPAIGAVDGLNRDFRTTASYVPGSTVLFLNGLVLIRSADNGWSETRHNQIRLKEAPLAGDDVQIGYLPL